MFTNKKAKYYGDNKVLLDSACLSSDTKPTTGVANGSKCIEMDTGKTYMFNEEDSEWEELPSSGGGGGGSSDFSTAEVTVTSNGGPAVEVFGILRDVSEIVGLPDSFYAVDEYNENPTGEITLTIVLYQGHALMTVWDANTISKSGNITTISTPDSGEIFDITGDCTITIS